MTDDSAHSATTAVQQQQHLDPSAWGQPISDERKTDLDTLAERQRAWAEQPAEKRGESAFHGIALTGADVYWLAIRAIVGPNATDEERSDASRYLYLDPLRHITIDLSALHLERADLFRVHLEGSILDMAHLEGATLRETHLEGATLRETHLEAADLFQAHLEGAALQDSHLEGTDLHEAHLEHGSLRYAYLDGAALYNAHLEGADLSEAHLEGADLRGAILDKTTRLNNALVASIHLDQVTLDNVNLSVVDWELAPTLGDETDARQSGHDEHKHVSGIKRAEAYAAAARAYRLLATALQAQGMSDIASRYAERAQIMQRKRYWHARNLVAYLGSLSVAVFAGYGYRLSRVFATYVLFVLGFAALYFMFGIPNDPHPYPWDYLLVSLTAIHGRTYFEQFSIHNPLSGSPPLSPSAASLLRASSPPYSSSASSRADLGSGACRTAS